MFFVNDVFTYEAPSGQQVTERVLWICESGAYCYTINLHEKRALPVCWKLPELEAMYKNKALTLQPDDQFIRVYNTEENLRTSEKDIRDKRWAKIESIVFKEPGIYQKHNRGKMIREAVEATGTNKKLIYQYLTQYWQRGKVKNALLPDFYRSGGKGKEKQFENGKRNGRPRKYAQVIGEGIVITEDIKRAFEISITRYYHITKNKSFSFTYEQMIRDSFNQGYRNENGVKMPILKDQKEWPSFDQFRYWYDKTYKKQEKARKQKGLRKSALENLVRLGTSVKGTDGPGTRFQIDATIADVYLVNSYNVNYKIGRPVVYLVMDSFSRMVVGVYVGLEGPSWLGAMMALANTASDKVAFCKQNDIEITKEKWPSHHLPQILLADRGELEGYNIERLSNTFRVKVENTGPYRADWKGIVERHFRTVQGSVKPFMPGTVDKEAITRGERHPNLDSNLTLEDFTKIIIHAIIQHNNHHLISRYNRDQEMIEDEVQPIPVELWNWGIRNKFGLLRTFPEDIVKLNLMPTDKAEVTGSGIIFKGIHYVSDRALSEDWFGQAVDNPWKISFHYDPRDMSQIYLPSSDGRDFEVATLKPHYHHYKEKSLVEVENYRAYQKMASLIHKQEEWQKKSDSDSRIKEVVKNAKRRMAKAAFKMSKRQQLQGVRMYRKHYKEERWLVERLRLSKNQVEEVKVIEETVVDKSVSPSSTNELLRRIRKEKMAHGKRQE